MLRSDPNFRPSQTLEDSGGGDNSSPANLRNRNFYRACIRSVERSPCLFKRERGWWSRGRFKFLSSLIFILGSWWFFPLLEGFLRALYNGGGIDAIIIVWICRFDDRWKKIDLLTHFFPSHSRLKSSFIKWIDFSNNIKDFCSIISRISERCF